MRFDLADLRLFLQIVEAGSITLGAQQAHLALASASERLRRMETDAGVQLLERRHRGIATTEAGEALAHHARLILRQQALMQHELQDFASGQRGTLTLYSNTAALISFLPSRLAPWLQANPHWNLDLKERTSRDIIRGLAAGLIDAGIVSDAVDAGDLLLQPLAADPLVLILPDGHPLATQRQLAFQELLQETFVGLAEGSALQEHISEQALAAGQPLHTRIRMKTFEGLCEMVTAGVGIAIIPDGIAKRLQRRHPHRRVRLTDAWTQRQLCLCQRRDATLPQPLQSLLQHLLQG